jgi:hypothetical protein
MIAVAPPPDLIYVPENDPWCAFGEWPYPVGSPFYFSDWSGNCDPADYGVAFGPGIAWPFSFWGGGYFDWHHHRVLIRRQEYGQFHPARSQPACFLSRTSAYIEASRPLALLRDHSALEMARS